MYSTYGYGNYGSSYDAATGIFAGLGILLAVIIIFSLALSILVIVAQWKIFTKGKQPGWASLIPIYNQYIMCKMVGVNPWWILIVFCASFLGIIPIIGALIVLAVSIYFTILLNVSLARAFGKEDAFAIGLILLPIVFYPILAFGQNEFVGENPMNDFVFKKASEVVGGNNGQTAANSDIKYCGNCGSKMDKKSKFCPSCGNEVK